MLYWKPITAVKVIIQLLQWTRADGQDLSKSMDYSKAQMEIMHLAYAFIHYFHLINLKVINI